MIVQTDKIICQEDLPKSFLDRPDPMFLCRLIRKREVFPDYMTPGVSESLHVFFRGHLDQGGNLEFACQTDDPPGKRAPGMAVDHLQIRQSIAEKDLRIVAGKGKVWITRVHEWIDSVNFYPLAELTAGKAPKILGRDEWRNPVLEQISAQVESLLLVPSDPVEHRNYHADFPNHLPFNWPLRIRMKAPAITSRE